MKISRNNVMGLMATTVYFASIIIIWSQLSEPIKLFMESENGQFWGEVLQYVSTLFLAVVLPIVMATMALQSTSVVQKKDCWGMSVIFIALTLISFPIVAEAIVTISTQGIDFVEFMEVVTTTKVGINEPNWPDSLHDASYVLYGLPARIILIIGLAAGALITLIWGWGKAVSLVTEIPEEANNQ